MPKEEIRIHNFRGVYDKASKFNQPEVYAATCRDFLITYEGRLVKRQGYKTAYLYNALYRSNGMSGNLLAIFELQTGQAAPNDLKYLAFTDASNGALYLWTPGTMLWSQIDGDITDFRDAAGTVQVPTIIQDAGAIRLLAGNRSGNYSIWWGYCGDRFLYAISDTVGTNAKVAGAFKTTASLANVEAPTASTYVTVAETTEPATTVTWKQAIIDETTDASVTHYVRYQYYISFQYDWGQWSPLSKADTGLVIDGDVVVSTPSVLRAVIKITLPASIDQRITGVRVWRARFWDSGLMDYAGGMPYLLAEVSLNEAIPAYVTGRERNLWPLNSIGVAATYTSASKTFKLDASHLDDIALANDMLNGAMLVAVGGTPTSTHYCLVTDTVFSAHDNQTIVVADGTGLVNGTSYVIYAVGAWYKSGTNYILTLLDTVSENIISAGPSGISEGALTIEQQAAVRAKYGTIINGLAIYANVYHNGESKPWLVSYGAISPGGVVSNDVHSVLNAFAVDSDIKGISSIGNRLIIYTGTAIYRGLVPSANASTWELERTFEQYGLLAPKSLVTINGKDYFLATDWEVKEFDGVVRPTNIGAGIYDTLRTVGNTSLAYLQAAVGYYLQKWRMYVLVLQTGASTYEHWGIDLSQNSPGWVQLKWQSTGGADKALVYFISTTDGRCLAADSASIYELAANMSSDDSNVIYPVYKTLPIMLNQSSKLCLKQVCVTYRSDTALIFNVYLDGSATAVTLASNSLAAHTTAAIHRINMPLGTRCGYFQLQFSLTSAQNSYIEIERIEVLVDVEGGGAS